MVLGDMHLAVVARAELGGEPTASEVAAKLDWRLLQVPGIPDGSPDTQRALTALVAAQEHGLVGHRHSWY